MIAFVDPQNVPPNVQVIRGHGLIYTARQHFVALRRLVDAGDAQAADLQAMIDRYGPTETRTLAVVLPDV